MAIGKLRGAWAEVVGPVIAARSEPVSLRGGVLTVRAEGGGWATELTLLGASVAAKADAFLEGSARVERVHVTAGPAGLSGAR
jgi:predicted nucleic acid-binding Zn ribbon protein